MTINVQLYQVDSISSETTYFSQENPKNDFYVKRLTVVSKSGECLTIELFASNVEVLGIPDSEFRTI